jgi:ABC-2 type transport system permease protein
MDVAHLSESDREQLEEAQFKKPYQPVAALLEGKFKSLYAGRIPYPYNTPKYNFLSESKPTAMIVVSDGDVIQNDVEVKDRNALPLGWDRYARQLYSNSDFVLNCMNYLCGDSALLNVRGRQLEIRLLDDKKAKLEKTKWQVINLVVPVLLIILLGVVLAAVRKARYAK